MRLDRTQKPYRQKYALLLNRKLQGEQSPEIQLALATLERAGVIDYGEGENEFFVVRLKDKCAAFTLHSYSVAAGKYGDEELAEDVHALAVKSEAMPNRKMPD